MSHSIKHADLVARALDALPDDDRARVDEALEQDEALRLEFEAIAGHLLQYDALPDAPPPPPFARIAERMDADEDPDLRVLRLDRAKGGRWIPFAAAAAAAAVACAFLFALPLRQGRMERRLSIERGPGMQVVMRTGGPELTCERPAEARIGQRTRVVLDGGARLDASASPFLISGRAWFEVEPGQQEFAVFTRFGRVVVLGTSFEVDVRHGSLRVAVAQGRVSVGGYIVEAGSTFASRTVKASTASPGAWFRMPSLRLEARGSPSRAGEPLALACVLRNPTNVTMRLEGPGSARSPFWIRFEDAAGQVKGEVPLKASNVVSGLELLEPGGPVVLEAGASKVLAVRILPPNGSAGAYRLTALYRPAGHAPVVSSPLAIEVR